MEATIINGSWKGHLGRGLAPRELQFLLWIAQGFTSKEIAREAGIEAGTVKKRLTNAMFKLGVTKRTALVAEAMKRQIITPVCFVLAALIAMHSMISDDFLRRDRRAPERRMAQMRMVRRAECAELAV
ncbi:helix-turn-helix transcriptional regulator [Pseudomonas sp. OE 28.3]|uniref:response regulator transcription factor n=1 Tax=Pseudomonas sp. OE 28.3 TaxID=2745519 RepID=UPI001645F6F3|nr:helix-turn-helix transcriptional regulator [Pseudomonas sp. OE 28.3]QXI57029.1 helix-turn-helix transcriptional regulator [Pseudomonas sp. OE 28.3]